MRFKWNNANSSAHTHTTRRRCAIIIAHKGERVSFSRVAKGTGAVVRRSYIPTQATGFSAMTPSIVGSSAAAMITDEPQASAMR
jgi:hypothetical protein